MTLHIAEMAFASEDNRQKTRRAEFLKCIFYYPAFSRNVTFLKQAVITRSPCQAGTSEEQDFTSTF